MNRIDPALLFVELSEIEEDPIMVEGKGLEDFAFYYAVTMPNLITEVTKCGKAYVILLEEEVLQDLYFDQSREKFHESILELILEQFITGPVVLFASANIIRELQLVFSSKKMFQGICDYYPFDNDSPEGNTHLIGIPSVPQKHRSDYRIRYMVLTAEKLGFLTLPAP